MRRRLLLVIVALTPFALTACSRFFGPLETRRMDRADPKDSDGNPLYTIDEQKARGRERYSLFDDDWSVGPRTYIDRPSPTGR